MNEDDDSADVKRLRVEFFRAVVEQARRRGADTISPLDAARAAVLALGDAEQRGISINQTSTALIRPPRSIGLTWEKKAILAALPLRRMVDATPRHEAISAARSIAEAVPHSELSAEPITTDYSWRVDDPTTITKGRISGSTNWESVWIGTKEPPDSAYPG